MKRVWRVEVKSVSWPQWSRTAEYTTLERAEIGAREELRWGHISREVRIVNRETEEIVEVTE